MHYFRLFIFIFFFLNAACRTVYQPETAKTSYISIDASQEQNKQAEAIIQPYKDSLDQSMNKVIAHASGTLSKGKPESALGNFFCDALQYIASDYFNETPDFCVMNYGGIRLPALDSGNITIRKIFELMPFDNFLVMMELDGAKVLELLNHISADGGWPLSGARLTIREQKAHSVFIGNEPLQLQKKYKVLLSDYMADGGDQLSMLTHQPYVHSGVFVRDALISYLIAINHQQKKIEPTLDGRIIKE